MREEQRDKDFLPGFVFALAFTIVNVYFYSFVFFQNLGIAFAPVNEFIGSLYKAHIFGPTMGFSYMLTKGLAIIFLIMTFIVRNGVGDDITWKKCWTITGVGLALFLFPPYIWFVPAEYASVIYLFTTIIGFVVLANGIKKMAGKFSSFRRQTNDPYESFQQNEILIETDESINLKMKYYWKGRWRNGWINIIEERRHMFVCGIPGSGKSYSVIEEQLIQDIEKGKAMFVYDFKYPDLSTLVYNVWMKNRNVYKEKWNYDDNFLVINFKDPRYSDRCNPLDPMYIRSLSDAQEASQTIMNDLIPDKDHGSDKFFGPSAEVYLAGLIWLLRNHGNGEFCTFPHLIELVSYDYKQVLEYAKRNPMMRKLFSAFIDADTPKSQGQIQGQIASARIPLMKMMDSYLYWVMSANDVPLDLNNRNFPKVMCIGNVPEKIKVTSTAISLIASRMFKEVNMFKGAPLNINIDECTTFHATGMDSTMATCRSKDIGFTIAVQDPNQMFRDWGEKEAKAIIGNLGTQFFGQSLGEYNRHVSELIGKEFREHQSLSAGDSDSVSTSFQLEERASVSALASLSQGEFIGWAADNVEHPNTLKQFHCFIQSDKEKRKAYREYTSGIPKSTRMKPFFNDDAIEKEIRDNPDQNIYEYFYNEIDIEEIDKKRRLKDYFKLNEEVIKINASQKAAELSNKEKEEVLAKIIEEKQIANMNAILTQNEDRIREEVESIFISAGITPQPAAPTGA